MPPKKMAGATNGCYIYTGDKQICQSGEGRLVALTVVPQMLENLSRADPKRIVFGVRNGTDWTLISQEEFLRRRDQWVGGLLAHGVRAGDRLVLQAPNGLEWELAHHAALRLGAVVVGLDLHDPFDRRKIIVASAAPSLLLVNTVTNEEEFGATITFSEFEAQIPTVLPALPPLPTSDAPATIIYTSGTTGDPKGILYTHGQLALATTTVA